MNLLDSVLGIVLLNKQGNGEKMVNGLKVKTYFDQKINEGDIIYTALLKKHMPIREESKQDDIYNPHQAMDRSIDSNCTIEPIFIKIDEIAMLDGLYYVESIKDKMPVLFTKSPNGVLQKNG